MPSSTRREFLLHSSVVSLGVCAALAATGAYSASFATIPIIDTHQHLWDFKKFRPPWLKDAPKINRSYTFADYAKETAGLNVVHTVYMEVDVDPRQQVAEAQYVIDTCKGRKTNMAAGVISCRPASAGFRAYAMRFRGNPYIKGMRQVLQVPECLRGLCLQSQYVKNIQLLGELGMSFDICIRPEELSDGYKLADLCPHTRFILDHCGNASARNPHHAQWKKDITEFAKRKNVVCKVSGIIKTVKPEWKPGPELEPIVKHVIDSFGTDRVMFGGDWPVCNLTFSFRAWVETLRWILRHEKEADQVKLFHDNARHVYGLT